VGPTPEPVRVRHPAPLPAPPRVARARERGQRQDEEKQQDRLQPREEQHRQHELDRDADGRDGGANRSVAVVPLVPDQLELVRVVGALEVREPVRPLREVGDVLGRVDDVEIGELDEEHVDQVGADLVEQREDRQEERGDRRLPRVACDDGVGDLLEDERRERPARVVEEREREDSGEPPRARAPGAPQDRDEPARERHDSNLDAWSRKSSA